MPIRAEAAELAEFLSQLVVLDRSFVEKLIDQRVLCNDAIADHPTVQVGEKRGRNYAGILGVLNGFLGTIDAGPMAGWGALTAIYEGGHLVRFEVRMTTSSPPDLIT